MTPCSLVDSKERISDMWLTVHRNLLWIKNQLDVIYVLSFISLLQVAQHVSGNHVPIFRSWRLRSVIATCWYCAVAVFVARTPQWTHYLLTESDSLPAATAQYQHVAIKLRSRQLLKMGTWLPETCWATCKVASSWFLIHTKGTYTLYSVFHRQVQILATRLTVLSLGW